jgi:hypothetical protein
VACEKDQAGKSNQGGTHVIFDLRAFNWRRSSPSPAANMPEIGHWFQWTVLRVVNVSGQTRRRLGAPR